MPIGVLSVDPSVNLTPSSVRSTPIARAAGATLGVLLFTACSDATSDGRSPAIATDPTTPRPANAASSGTTPSLPAPQPTPATSSNASGEASMPSPMNPPGPTSTLAGSDTSRPPINKPDESAGAGGRSVEAGFTAGGNAGQSAFPMVPGNGGSTPAPSVSVSPSDYAIAPPSQCHNRFDYQAEGCIPGDESTLCGGKCNTINACLETPDEKPFADVTFICPRFMLFSDQMRQAAIDDGNTDFNYAIVGHDVDRGGIDGEADSSCCQCYQLVFAHPSVNNERQAQLNPDNPTPPTSALPLPKPLIAQSFNTAATPHSFDVYMGAGGLGANNACAPVVGSTSRSGQYMYTAYPEVGQTSGGGVKAVTHFPQCKNDIQWVTEQTLSSDACQAEVRAACEQIESTIDGLTEQARDSCLRSNRVESAYHLNWSVYAMKVECPRHLTEVTGCRLAPQGLPQVDRSTLSADRAATNTGFFNQATNGEMYETTTMEDCCRPSCANTDWVEGRGLTPDGDYNAFYSCDAAGIPLTEQPR